MYRIIAGMVLAASVSAFLGCESTTSKRLNAPPMGFTEKPSELQEQLVYMNDNALLSDMCFGDVHFVPNTSELNGLGVRRIRRYAALMKQYGGTLHYNTNLGDDEEIVVDRIAHVREYLQLAGLEADRFDIELGGPGGRGMRNEEAVRALHNAENPPKDGMGGSSIFGK